MNRWLRETERGVCAFLFVITLVVQSVLPVYADTADTNDNTAETALEVEESGTVYSLDYFDRIAVNSVRGILTIRYGEEFSISFPAGWEQAPVFSVQDDILVVSGRKASGAKPERSGSGSAVVLGEDEPAEPGTRQAAEAEEPYEADDSGETTAAVPEMVITIPPGVGLDTLRIAMESGDLCLSDITANSVTIQSGGGNLTLRDVSLGTVDIYTEDGAVSMEESTFGSLNIGMGEGEVSVCSDDGLSGCRIELKTGNGEITYNGEAAGAQFLQPGNGKRFLTVQIGSGDIRIDG